MALSVKGSFKIIYRRPRFVFEVDVGVELVVGFIIFGIGAVRYHRIGFRKRRQRRQLFGGGDGVMVVFGIVASSGILYIVENLFGKGNFGIVLHIRFCPVAVDVHSQFHVFDGYRLFRNQASGSVGLVVALEGDSGRDGDRL